MDEARTSQQLGNNLLSFCWFHLFSSIPVFIVPFDLHSFSPVCLHRLESRFSRHAFWLHYQETLKSERSTRNHSADPTKPTLTWSR